MSARAGGAGGAAPVIVVHGGAGERPPGTPEAEDARAGCAVAAAIGYRILTAGGSALDAVEAAVRALEDDERFNAGRGSCLTRAGTVEMDASIMSGAAGNTSGAGALALGAVAVVTGVRNPITLARRVLDAGEHVLLAGEGALAFAREVNADAAADAAAGSGGVVELVAPDYHVTDAARAALARELARRDAAAGAAPSGGGTVGAVALDRAGHVAAATSTGGMNGKRPGRIGDSPLAGAGTYADDEGGAASATGHGERIIQVALTKTAVDLLRAGVPAPEAAARALATLDRVAGKAGLIVVDRAGGIAAAFNTASMAWAARGGTQREI